MCCDRGTAGDWSRAGERDRIGVSGGRGWEVADHTVLKDLGWRALEGFSLYSE